MVNILLRSLAIILFFSGCGDGTDGLPKAYAPTYARVYYSNICDKDSSEYRLSYLDVKCDVFEQLDYVNNPPENCEEVTITTVDHITLTVLFVSAEACE